MITLFVPGGAMAPLRQPFVLNQGDPTFANPRLIRRPYLEREEKREKEKRCGPAIPASRVRYQIAFCFFSRVKGAGVVDRRSPAHVPLPCRVTLACDGGLR